MDTKDQKIYFNEEQVKDYLLKSYLESLNKICEYAETEPQITRIAVLCLGESCIEIAVWLTDISEENCDKFGARICGLKSNLGSVFPCEFYLSGRDPDKGLVVYNRAIKEA